MLAVRGAWNHDQNPILNLIFLVSLASLVILVVDAFLAAYFVAAATQSGNTPGSMPNTTSSAE